MPDVRATTPLPVWQTVRETYAVTFANIGVLWRLARLWAIVVAFAVALISAFFWPSHEASLESGAAMSWVQLLTFAVSLAAASSVAVAWHRLILLGQQPRNRGYLAFDAAVRVYFGLALVLTLPAFALPLRLGRLDDPWSGAASMALLLFAICVGPRLALHLPARAIGRSDVTLAVAWRATRGQWWRLVVGSVLVLLPVLVVGTLVSMPELVRDQWADEPVSETHLGFVIFSVKSELATFACSVIAVSFLSRAFRHLFPGPPDGAAVSDGASEP